MSVAWFEIVFCDGREIWAETFEEARSLAVRQARDGEISVVLGRASGLTRFYEKRNGVGYSITPCEALLALTLRRQ